MVEWMTRSSPYLVVTILPQRAALTEEMDLKTNMKMSVLSSRIVRVERHLRQGVQTGALYVQEEQERAGVAGLFKLETWDTFVQAVVSLNLLHKTNWIFYWCARAQKTQYDLICIWLWFWNERNIVCMYGNNTCGYRLDFF